MEIKTERRRGDIAVQKYSNFDIIFVSIAQHKERPINLLYFKFFQFSNVINKRKLWQYLLVVRNKNDTIVLLEIIFISFNQRLFHFVLGKSTQKVGCCFGVDQVDEGIIGMEFSRYRFFVNAAWN